MPAGSVVEGGDSLSALGGEEEDRELQPSRTADPLANCYLPGVPRIIYMEFPFQIFQAPDQIAMTFEWSQVHRTIYTNGSQLPKVSTSGWATRAGAGKATHWSLTSETTTTAPGSTWRATSTARSCMWWSATRCWTRHVPLRSDDRRSQGLHQALEDQHAPSPAQGHGPAARVPVPGRGGGSQRRLGARSADLVSAAMSDFLMTITRVPLHVGRRVDAGRRCWRLTWPRRRPSLRRRPLVQWPRMLMGSQIFQWVLPVRSRRPRQLGALQPAQEAFSTPGGGRGVIIDPPDGKPPCINPWARDEKASR